MKFLIGLFYSSTFLLAKEESKDIGENSKLERSYQHDKICYFPAELFHFIYIVFI
jgi:hypothetical protein